MSANAKQAQVTQISANHYVIDLVERQGPAKAIVVLTAVARMWDAAGEKQIANIYHRALAELKETV